MCFVKFVFIIPHLILKAKTQCPANLIEVTRKPKNFFLHLPSPGVLLQIPPSSILPPYYHSHFVDTYYTVFLRVCKALSKYHLQLIGGRNKSQNQYLYWIFLRSYRKSDPPSTCVNSCFSFQLAEVPPKHLESKIVCFQSFQPQLCCP